MPRRSNIRAPPAVGKKLNNFAAQNRKERGRKQKYLGRKDKRAGGFKTKNEDKNIDVSSTLFKTVVAVFGLFAFFAGLFILLLWIVKSA